MILYGMKKIFLTGFWMFVFTVLFTSTALAQTKTKSIIKLPVFMAGDVQTVDKPIDGDLMIAGKEVKVISKINGDTYVAGGNVEISGEINGNLIVAGGKVKVLGKVLKNLIMAGGEITVNDSATIGGYVLAGGKKVDLLGNFMGPVKLGAENLLVGEKAIISGNLDADVSTSEISSTAKITGEKNIKFYEVKKPEIQTNQWKQLAYTGKTISFLSKLLILLILIRLFGQKIKKINIKDSFWSAIGLGLVVLIVVPILALILMVTVIAAPLSVIILTTYLIGLYLSTIVASIFVGNFISEKAKFKTNTYVQGFVGLLSISLIGLIPFVGGLVKLIVFLFGVGIIFKSLKQFFSKK
jgi:hypothetical protein